MPIEIKRGAPSEAVSWAPTSVALGALVVGAGGLYVVKVRPKPPR